MNEENDYQPSGGRLAAFAVTVLVFAVIFGVLVGRYFPSFSDSPSAAPASPSVVHISH